MQLHVLLVVGTSTYYSCSRRTYEYMPLHVILVVGYLYCSSRVPLATAVGVPSEWLLVASRYSCTMVPLRTIVGTGTVDLLQYGTAVPMALVAQLVPVGAYY